NTALIAEKCKVEFDNKIFMPEFQIPASSKSDNLDEYLRELTYNGLRERFGEISEHVKTRAEFELDVIIKMKFPGYFLIVADFMKAAGELGVRVGPGRGSAAGSLVAYALGIVNVNPLDYDLLFERFLNPERVSMPDIDIDFQDDKRDLIIDYVKRKYGEDSVAQIITFGSLLSKAVLTDVGRVLGVPLSTVKSITAKIPTIRGKVRPLKEALTQADLKWVSDSDDEKIKELIEYSLILEGKVRSAGTHAAGVVIAPGDIGEFVPLYQPPKQKTQSVDISTQFTMKDLEDAGLLKMDFLGLRTLSIIDNTLKMIKQNYNIDLDIEKIDFHDKATYDMLSEGNTLAVFQFESTGMQDYLKRLKPRNLEELTAMNALYRPGPMENIPDFIDRKFGRKPIEYLAPAMENAIKNTYGIIVYQEQVMQLCRDVAGFSLSQADILRRGMAKKQKYIMDEQKPMFVEGAQKNGIEPEISNEIFELIYKFADYGFNKSHSLAYSYLAFQTAWLKTHYPEEFLAANMTAEMNDQTKVVLLIEEAKKFNISVKPPDVNKSAAYFIAEKGTIYFGMAAIKNVGVSAVESIVAARSEKPFTNLFDFVKRVDTRLINKRALEALVCSGAFDSLKTGHRAALLASIEIALEYSHKCQSNETTGMVSLFGGGATESVNVPDLALAPEWSEKERLEHEKEYLNFYVSGHPLYRYLQHLNSFSTLKLSDKESRLIGGTVQVCGIITDIRTRLDKKDKTIAFIKLEDLGGKAECVFWSDSYVKCAPYLHQDSIVMVTGKAELRDEDLQIIADEVIPIENAVERFAKGYKIWIDLANSDESRIRLLKERFCVQNGYSDNRLLFYVHDKDRNFRTSYDAYGVNIKIDHQTAKELMNLFGSQNIGFIV
ncbi:MAG: polymerase subunit alpha, partial [Bacteroidota bacterium]|nr:polymerase subunit alpha [Bacteroidota bacterium]